MAKAKSTIPAEELALYDAAAKAAGLIRKGVSMPYTSCNGHMHSIMRKDGALGVRLSKPDTEAFAAKWGFEQFTNYGSNMREYVTVPEKLLHDTQELSEWLEKSLAYIKSLPPKPTTKKNS